MQYKDISVVTTEEVTAVTSMSAKTGGIITTMGAKITESLH